MPGPGQKDPNALEMPEAAEPVEPSKGVDAAPEIGAAQSAPKQGPGANVGPALADAIVIFHTICGARRIEVVREPWLAPPEYLDVQTAKRRVIQVAGQNEAPFESRRFDFVQTVQVAPIGLAVHLYKERI